MANIVKQPCDEGVIRSKPCIEPCSRNLRSWILAATILGSSMAMIDNTVVNVALPVLQTVLNATAADVQWIVESYALFLAALILVGGSLGDRFGRRRIFAYGVALFAAASVWCGLAPNVNQLIIARAVQGIGGALLVPGSLAIISASFSAEQRGQAIGTWSGFTGITSALGPVLGGWLIENASWRWIFFLNVPLAAIVLSIALWRMPDFDEEGTATKLDWWGAGLAAVGLGTLVYGLIESSHLSLAHPRVISALAVSVVALLAFIFVEANSRAPMMPLTLFRSRTFSGANLLTLLLYSALSGVLFFFPFNLIQVQGYSATAAGSAFLPLILIMFLLSRWSGGLVGRYGAKCPLTIGPIIAAIGFGLFAIPGIGGSYWTTFFPAVFVLGLGMAITVAPLTTTVMGAVEVRQAGIASGINNAVARTAGLLSIAVLSIIVLRAFNFGLDRRLAPLKIPPEVQQVLDQQRIKLAGAEVPAGLSNELSAVLRRAIAESFVDSFRLVIFIAVGLALVSALIAALTLKKREKSNRTSTQAS
ncbi:MFS transporter [Chroococcidiopsis sp. CCMEE 29]|uniref:MFS transporter n=1 Tax=Chroococcidiopsis sp. CCMEE 29 TaxID=155894 RepID=UPI0020229748|nr:MFS transporter [Chroococcidiopsis sp. CCMEE 29]